MKLLVCGGRDYFDKAYLGMILDEVHAKLPITALAHGGATGADSMASDWAAYRQIPCYVFKAEWARYGKKAGPMRNERMLRQFRPDAVIAFPGGRGTQDMIRQARMAKVLTIVPDGRSTLDGKPRTQPHVSVGIVGKS